MFGVQRGQAYNHTREYFPNYENSFITFPRNERSFDLRVGLRCACVSEGIAVPSPVQNRLKREALVPFPDLMHMCTRRESMRGFTRSFSKSEIARLRDLP